MFTCSSCGYEANPDSAPACSLCGTKKPGAGGSSVGTATKAAAVADDELASVAKAVAETASDAPAPARASGKGKAAAGGGPRVVETAAGILRRSKEPAEITNACSLLGAFVGAVAGYVFEWHQIAHAPATFGEAIPGIALAVVFGFVARIALSNMLEASLSHSGRDTFATAGAGLAGVGFLVFTIFAFVQGGRVASSGATPDRAVSSAIGSSGQVLAEHLALLTSWSFKTKTPKYIALVSGPSEVRIPTGSLTADDVAALQKDGLPLADIERYAVDDPYKDNAYPLPDGFSAATFLSQLGSVLAVQKDATAKPPWGRILLTHQRSDGTEENLSFTTDPRTPADIATALPRGIKVWIGVALGLPPHGGSEQEAFASSTIDKYTASQ
jgi:hypothetical protein